MYRNHFVNKKNPSQSSSCYSVILAINLIIISVFIILAKHGPTSKCYLLWWDMVSHKVHSNLVYVHIRFIQTMYMWGSEENKFLGYINKWYFQYHNSLAEIEFNRDDRAITKCFIGQIKGLAEDTVFWIRGYNNPILKELMKNPKKKWDNVRRTWILSDENFNAGCPM